jgi:hypothetical protein
MNVLENKKYYIPLNNEMVFLNHKYLLGENITELKKEEITEIKEDLYFFDEYGITEFVDQKNLLVADVIPDPKFYADDVVDGKYRTKYFILNNVRPIESISCDIIKKLQRNCYELQATITQHIKEKEILRNLPKVKDIVQILNTKYNVFEEFVIDKIKVPKAKIRNYLENEIEEAQIMFESALKLNEPNVEVLSQEYNNKSINIVSNYKNVVNRINDSIELYNAVQNEYHRLNKRFDLIFDESSGFIYIKKLENQSFTNYNLYIYILHTFVKFLMFSGIEYT